MSDGGSVVFFGHVFTLFSLLFSLAFFSPPYSRYSYDNSWFFFFIIIIIQIYLILILPKKKKKKKKKENYCVPKPSFKKILSISILLLMNFWFVVVIVVVVIVGVDVGWFYYVFISFQGKSIHVEAKGGESVIIPYNIYKRVDLGGILF